MGTNFYFHTQDKEYVDKWFDIGEFEITDFPSFGYSIHIAKTSGGWLPLFQSHKKVPFVSDMKRAYEDGSFQIVDEYGQAYSWEEFQERVVEFGLGVDDAISHFAYENGKYSHLYHKDKDGNEYTWEEFS